MKEAKVNVPVLLWVFVRPEQIKRVFDVLKEARPSILFLVSDGPRKHVPSDNERIAASRKVVEDIDWDCQVHRLYFEENQGIYPMHKITCDYIFKLVDRCVFLEDDIIPSVSYFKYCEELLERYKDDLRINMIGGMNHMEIYEEPNTDYFFTKAASIWGFAFWRRTYESFYDFEYGNDNYVQKRLIENTNNYKGLQKSINGYVKDQNYNGHLPGIEFFLGLSCFMQNQLSIVPKKNMVCNIGYGEGAANIGELAKMDKLYRNLFDMQTHDLEFPLKHPKYVVEDTYYEKIVGYILGKEKPHITNYKKFDKTIWNIYRENKKSFINKVKRKLIKVTRLGSK